MASATRGLAGSAPTVRLTASSTGEVSSMRPTGWSKAARPLGGPATLRIGCSTSVCSIGVAAYGSYSPGPTGGDTRAAPLPAAREAGKPQAVVGGHDGRPAEGQFAGQLALGRQAGARRQQPDLDGAGERGGQLLVERIGPGRPRPEQLHEQRRPRPSTAFSVHLMPIGSWCRPSCSPIWSHTNPLSRPIRRRLDPAGPKGRGSDDVRSDRSRRRGGRHRSSFRSSSSRSPPLRYGADSRPGIDDRDQRPWLVPGH